MQRSWGGGELWSTLSCPAGAPGVSPHGHGLGVPDDVVQVGDGALELPAVDGLGGLARVLEGDAEVGAAGAGGFGGFDVGGCVADLGGGKFSLFVRGFV